MDQASMSYEEWLMEATNPQRICSSPQLYSIFQVASLLNLTLTALSVSFFGHIRRLFSAKKLKNPPYAGVLRSRQTELET